MIGDHPPKGPGIGRADGLSFVDDGGAAGEEGRVDDVGMADHPAHVGGRPIGVARPDAVEIAHRPLKRHHVPSVVADHALGLSGGAGGVEHIERVRREDRQARRGVAGRLGLGGRRRPVVIAPGDHAGLALRPLQDEAGGGLRRRDADRLVHQRLVGHDAAGLDAARGGEDEMGAAIVDAGRELARREAAEHHRMHRPDAGAGEHGDQRLGDHGHVDQHPIPGLHAEIANDRRERLDLAFKFRVGELADGAGHGAVVDDGEALAMACRHMPVDGVMAGVAHAIRIPTAVDARASVEHGRGRPEPVDGTRRLSPKADRIAFPARVDFGVTAFRRFVHRCASGFSPV